MFLDSLLKLVSCVLCFYLLLHHSQSESTNETASNNSSQEHVLPTPLILHLNQSAAQLLIQEANNMFVSNTSINDIISNNETQVMLMRYRERKRQVRIMAIQRDILQKLGLTRGPNVTARLSAEERQSLVRSFDRTMLERTEQNSNDTTTCTDSDNSAC
ncbi:uncharacterized protein TNIN_115261 [Trichonephila inaurata madagascariensis]|uniref:Uncharacterized protein n=1 Tax=Trichonephila inaurata madagascariensis TaxID=2747483 RepID=A0A8X6MFS7_9ARAC|nr:uncharacterized protein TNIN_115261 [Trichonephila inaurata madagascariensis]